MFEAIDLCAGAGGWSIAAHELGITTLGIEIDADACATRQKAGLPTVQGDVTKLPLGPFSWPTGMIGSPPCPSFSRAGNIRGQDDALCTAALERITAEGPEADIEELRSACVSEASMVVVEPLRWALAIRPDWITLEQVPPVLALWERTGVVLEEHGYFVWTGILNAADFGTPQLRKRAILIASRLAPVVPPSPSHAKDGKDGLTPWVPMSDAVGWGFTKRPAPTLPATSKGGPRVLDGGSGARQTVLNAIARGEWKDFTDGRQVSRTGAVRASEAEAGLLQGFPRDWPWTGRIQAIRHRQIGNAIPPLLAKAILLQARPETDVEAVAAVVEPEAVAV